MKLSEFPVHTTIPVTDLARAKAFYEGVLGFEAEVVNGQGTLYGAGGGTRFLVYQSAAPSSGTHTILGISVDDIVSVVESLRAAGVTFEEYDLPGLKTVDGIADSEPGRAAWFKDPEGNVIGVVQLTQGS